MRKYQIAFLSLFVSIVFAGCSQATSTNDSLSSASTNSGTAAAGSGETALKQQVSLEQAEQSRTAPTAVERKIIRNAELTLEVESPDDAQTKITAIAESKGGFVIASQKQSNDTKATKNYVVTMTARVPAAQFDASLAEIRQAGGRVIVETVKGQDVTDEFIDVEARLKTQKALEEQFLEIMKQSKTVADALNVQTEIARVRGEIEKVEGRKRFLENQSSFSTLQIRLQSANAANSAGFFYQLSEAVSNGFSAAMNVILFLVMAAIALLPFLIFIVLPIYLVIRYFLRKSRKQKSSGDIAREEIKNG